MKNLSLGMNILLAIAVVGLYILHFSADKKEIVNNAVAGDASIVYINTDSLLLNYDMAKDLNEAFFKKQEERRTSLNIKIKKLEREAADFQKKAQNNGFLSRERAEKAQRSLLLKRESIQKKEQEYNELARTEQREINKKLLETITSYLNEFNKIRNFNMILSTTLGGNVIYSKDGLDVTKDVLKGLNVEYKK
jgi:outer membrane protein